MAAPLKYIVDDHGHKTSILVPIKMWLDLNDNFAKLQNKLNILKGINEGLNEVRNAGRSGRRLQTLEDFLK